MASLQQRVGAGRAAQGGGHKALRALLPRPQAEVDGQLEVAGAAKARRVRGVLGVPEHDGEAEGVGDGEHAAGLEALSDVQCLHDQGVAGGVVGSVEGGDVEGGDVGGVEGGGVETGGEGGVSSGLQFF